MHVIADLQLHSRFSRAVSPQMTLPNIAAWAARKGIGLVATGDWMHPIWFREIESQLEEQGNGLLKLKPETRNPKPETLFLLATEVSSIYSQGGKVRRVHTLIWVPTIQSARKISQEMTKRGCNLMSDGRPIVGLSCIHIAELVLSIEPKALIIPAHAWTPWFSVYGEKGGFESLDEAFGPYAKHIYAVETGLSSNPAMNWRIKELDHRSILSFSDAHSGPKLGREATVFNIPEISYEHIYQAIRTQTNIAYTIEFYPEEGKYHWSGHRACGIRWGPEDTKVKGTTCPVCGKPLVQGVVQRVEALAGRSEADLQLSAISYQLSDNITIPMTASKAFPNRPPFVMLVPLQEIISECIGSPVGSKKIVPLYDALVSFPGGEFGVLLTATLEEITQVAGARIAEGIDKVRRGDLVIDPGYDGVFGVVKLWREGEEKPLVDASKEQLSMFS
ncbi:MAG: UvrD/REP helicase [Candidatus Uhrbacteria bacterium GW2011_GWA2_53_10]|uniref:UvrD/REP helicase n=1 Tax=Candidatus Uhrbacteria bacterium GW2011_GWA2_53_10 TaxID=1618980 RepID=A0A0G1XMD1_9BACT|nr:MAG: UvrD/REP helicase [Candidatus Uhrbacteria bacterium GW2011_GWA2_53_10]